MFIGTYYHTLEEKGRLSLPKVFRDKTKNWVVARGLDGGLFLFTKEKFTQEVKLATERRFTKKKNRDFARLLANQAKALETDKNGRVHLPEYLITFAKLKKKIVVVGSLEKIEIWDLERYHKYLEKIESQAEIIAEAIEDES